MCDSLIQNRDYERGDITSRVEKVSRTFSKLLKLRKAKKLILFDPKKK